MPGFPKQRDGWHPAVCVVLFLGLLASACTTAPPPRPTPLPSEPQANEAERWQHRVSAINAMTAWRVRGKVAYRLPDDAGSASLDWQQQDTRSELRLAGPLGAGSTRISNEGALLRLQRDGIERLYPADAAPWLPEGKLLPVPVNAIQHWLRGVPDPTLRLDALQLENALALRIEQDGWLVTYDEYGDQPDAAENAVLALPIRLSLQHAGTGLSLRVLLRDWRLQGN